MKCVFHPIFEQLGSLGRFWSKFQILMTPAFAWSRFLIFTAYQRWWLPFGISWFDFHSDSRWANIVKIWLQEMVKEIADNCWKKTWFKRLDFAGKTFRPASVFSPNFLVQCILTCASSQCWECMYISECLYILYIFRDLDVANTRPSCYGGVRWHCTCFLLSKLLIVTLHKNYLFFFSQKDLF